jgi:hypothetical protein
MRLILEQPTMSIKEITTKGTYLGDGRIRYKEQIYQWRAKSSQEKSKHYHIVNNHNCDSCTNYSDTKNNNSSKLCEKSSRELGDI